MATCDPKLLPALATCFRCVPPDAKRLLNLYLLNIATASKSVPQLAAGAAPYRPIHNKLALAARVYLLALISGQPTSPGALEKAAVCWQCIPVSERLDIETYLYAVTAGGSTDPKKLMPSAGLYRPLIPIREQVEIYLLNAVAMISTQAIMAGAACFMCLSTTRLDEIYLYLLCQGIATNIIPPGSTYGPGATPEFDLNVASFTTYTIMWGANDLYVTICGVRYNSTGAGTSIIVFTKNCTVMKFFGTFAGTTVTAKVMPNPAHSAPATPTGFTWAISGANAVAGWNAPPVGVINTEVWTSADGVTYTLAGTVAAPGTSFSTAAPTSPNALWAEIRFIDSQNAYSTFTTPLVADADVANWATRVVSNGGAAPSTATKAAMSTFVTSLKSAGLWTKMYILNVIAPDNLTAARTPLVVGAGSDPWGNNGGNLVAGDLTINGLAGNGSNKWLNTGWNENVPNATDPIFGMTIYNTTSNANANESEIGIAPTVSSNDILWIAVNNGAGLTSGIMPLGSNNVFVSVAGGATWTGYTSVNRSSTTNLVMYKANSTNAHAQVSSNATTPTAYAAMSALPLFVLAANGPTLGTPNNPSSKRVSFAAIHQPLSLSDSASFYNAIQALRTAFGGGFV